MISGIPRMIQSKSRLLTKIHLVMMKGLRSLFFEVFNFKYCERWLIFCKAHIQGPLQSVHNPLLTLTKVCRSYCHFRQLTSFWTGSDLTTSVGHGEFYTSRKDQLKQQGTSTTSVYSQRLPHAHEGMQITSHRIHRLMILRLDGSIYSW